MSYFIQRKLVKLLVGPFIKAHAKRHQTPYTRLIRAAWRKL